MTDMLFSFKQLVILPVAFIVILLFNNYAFSGDLKTVKIVDSLVKVADSCLENSYYQCAKDAYVNAFLNGMSRDSLAFFIAALYIKKGNFDTALVYNLSCTTSTSILFPAVLDQRTSILTAHFPGHQSDSSSEKQLLETKAGQQKSSIGFSLYASYLENKTNKFPFIQEIDKLHDALAFETGNSFISIFYDYLLNSRSGNFEPHFKLNIGGVMPLDSTFFSSYSTKSMTGAFEILIRNKKNMHTFFNRLYLQCNLKTVNYSDQIFFVAPMIRGKWFYMPRITGRLFFENRGKIDDANIGGSLYLSPLVKSNFQKAFGLLLSYTWKEKQSFFNYIQANTDSVIDGKPQTFYFDQNCTDPFTYESYTTGYWPYLTAKPVLLMPGQTIDISPVFNSIITFFNSFQIEPSISIQGQYFINRVQTLTLKNKNISFFDLKEKGNVIVLFYNKQKNSYYYCNDAEYPNNSILRDENLVNFEKRRRFDATIFLQTGFRYSYMRSFEIAINGWYSKSVSTLDQDAIPIPLPDYNWGINTEWNLQFGVGKRVKKAGT
jgi:hypothetical protein